MLENLLKFELFNELASTYLLRVFFMYRAWEYSRILTRKAPIWFSFSVGAGRVCSYRKEFAAVQHTAHSCKWLCCCHTPEQPSTCNAPTFTAGKADPKSHIQVQNCVGERTVLLQTEKALGGGGAGKMKVCRKDWGQQGNAVSLRKRWPSWLSCDFSICSR